MALLTENLRRMVPEFAFDDELRFRERQNAALLFKARWAYLVTAALFASFAWLDQGIAPGSSGRNLPMRIAAVGMYVLLHALTWPRGAIRLVVPSVLIGVAGGAAACLWISVANVNGELVGVGSLLLMTTLTTALTPAFRTALAAYLLLVATSNVLAILFRADSYFFFVVNAFVISGCAGGLMLSAVSERQARRAFALELELEVLATRDSLTGARNRASFMRIAAEELDRAARYVRPVSMLLLDIDRFKTVNDTHGHPAGDAVIKQLAVTCAAGLRTMDQLGRLGGEEFAILLPETDLPRAEQVAERLRVAVEAVRVPVGSKQLSFTVSIGVAERPSFETLDQLMSRVDEALYAAKHGGRNQVQAAAEPPGPAAVPA